jgi:DNA polymerase III subunit epsilon
MYAVVDIETNGGNFKTGKITEIAIFLFNGEEITESFQTLINPETEIPYQITRLTGITDKMVRNAPKFYEVARKIVEMTANRIFVAHNVSFDYNFIRQEFLNLGYNYHRKTLCTVEMSRKYLPGYPSYSLGNICSALDIKLSDRHRAAGDARATVELLHRLLKEYNQKTPSLFA